MKPLTIEEIKSLKVYDWVWLEPDSEEAMGFSAGYYKIAHNWFPKASYEYEHCVCFTGIEEDPTLAWSNYGTEWFAYKNKEQAEAKGEIVELPCRLGQPLYTIERKYDHITFGNVYYKIDHNYYAGEIVVCEDGLFRFYTPTQHPKSLVFGEDIFTDKSEAERRLAELKGEKV